MLDGVKGQSVSFLSGCQSVLEHDAELSASSGQEALRALYSSSILKNFLSACERVRAESLANVHLHIYPPMRETAQREVTPPPLWMVI